MNRGSTLFLRAALVGMGAIILALCIFALPALWAGVADEYPDHTYVFYTILSGLYVAAIPFYGALYQAGRLLNLIDAGQAFTIHAVRALRRIATSATIISGIFTLLLPFFYMWADGDDAPGLLVFALFLVLAPCTIAVFAAVMQRLFKEAIDIKSENELTV
jgi:hypothetical protein